MEISFNKSKLAALVAAASVSIALTACGGGDRSNSTTEGSTSTTTSTSTSTTTTEDASRISSEYVTGLTAEILGVVQDTNGNPLVGATVSIGSASTTTDANGAYSLAGVAVTGFTMTADGYYTDQTADAIYVSIVPATSDEGVAEYLSATATVTPSATTILQTEAGDSANTEDSLLALVTTDGMAVSAGVTMIPALGATGKGVIRDSDTGMVLSGVVVGLDMTNVSGSVSYNSTTTAVATNDAGEFEFTNLPVDSYFSLSVEDYSVISGMSTINTTAETVANNIGTVYVDAISSSDDIAPVVTSVTGVVNASTGLLNDDLDGTQGLVINFSEPMADEVDANSVFVYNNDEEVTVEVASATLSADATSLTVVTAEALPAGTEVIIYLNLADFQDLSGNVIEQGSLSYDDGLNSVGAMDALALYLNTYADPVTDVAAVANLTQIATGESVYSDAQEATSAVQDVTDFNNYVEQLNSSDAEARLEDLIDAIETVSSDVYTNVAKVSFEVTSDIAGQDLEFEVSDGTVGIYDADGFYYATGGFSGSYAAGTYEYVLYGVEAGDVVTVSTKNDFGVATGVATVTLTDQIAATPVLQKAYGIDDYISGGTAGGSVGAGAELVGEVEGTAGSLNFPLTTWLLLPQGEGGIPVTGNSDNLWADLEEGMVAELDDARDAGVPYAYDAAAWTAWMSDSFARTIGVEFSENVAVVADVAPTFTGTTALSSWAAQNDVTTAHLGGSYDSDLIKFSAANVFTLANDDDGTVLNFSGAVQDESGNVSDDTAQVVLQDYLPPFITTAVYTDGEFVITYNEELDAVADQDATVTLEIVHGDTDVYYAVSVDMTEVTISGATLTIPQAAFSLPAAFTDISAAFEVDADNGEYGLIRIPDIADSEGNSWDSVNAAITPLVAVADPVQPFFAVLDETVAFTIGTDSTTYRDGATSFTVDLNFTHPIVHDWDGSTDNGSVTLTAADAADLVDTGGNFAYTDVAGEYVRDDATGEYTLTLTFTGVTGVDQGDGLNFYGVNGAATYVSEWDGSTQDVIGILAGSTL